LNKAPDAFRTISEVAEDLDLPQHVLRFWESRFPQIKPMKRGGGRRYYRPEDIDLLRGIRHLLYGEGYTIRGVQRILKEQGLRTVQSVGQGRPVALPEPTPEDAQTDEAEAQNSVPTFLPAIFSSGGPRSVPEEPGDDAPETDAVSAAPALSQPAPSQPAQSQPAPSRPAVVAAAAARPAGLGPEELDRLKTILGRLEECRQLLDQAVGSAG
jgi:DNA-binding transcriptional MerR regulator